MVVVPPQPDNASAVAAAVDVAPSAGLGEDVPCIGCGYNLRGLTGTGRCPECGTALYPSVVRHRNRRRPLPPPDPRWARQVAEGALLSLVAFALAGVLILAPQDWYVMPYQFAPSSRSPGRAALLGVAATAWVLAWYSAWKLTRQPPAGELIRHRGRLRWARWPLSLYLLCPFLAPGFGETMNGPAALTILFLFLCGIVGGAALLWHVAGLFDRIHHRWTAGETGTLAVVNTLAAVLAFLMPWGHGGISSLDLMLDLPLVPYGMPRALRRVAELVVQGATADPVLVAYASLALWNGVLMARLFRSYLRLSFAPGAEPVGVAPSVE
jgi:hypothetical protein